jgi:putative nucleotidyltransferase-like protein
MLDLALEPAYAPLGQLPAVGLALRLGASTAVLAFSGSSLTPIVRAMTSVIDGMLAPEHAARARTGRAVFCVANASHFPGAVALVNSLRLTGWGDEIVIVDCGLEQEQRSLLAREARIVPASEGPDPPQLVKVAGPLSYPTETAIVLDADMIVTRAIEPLVAQAERTGRMLAVADRLDDRFDERWGDLLGLGELRRHPYVNCGFLIVPAGVGERLFGFWRDAQAHIDLDRSLLGAGRPSDPLFFADQDVLNAVLASARFAAEELTVLDFGTAPHAPFPGLRIVDAQRLHVTRDDGSEPFVLHHIQRKPWLEPLAPNVYSELLPRLWLADDVPLRLEPGSVPLRFRPGLAGEVGSRLAAAQVAALRRRHEVGSRLRSTLLVTSPAQNATDDPSALWRRVEELAEAAPLVTDLVAHRLECFEVRRRRRLGIPVPDALARYEFSAIAANRGAKKLLEIARASYDGPMLLFKGYEVALHYPEPWLRPFTGLDLLVDDSQCAQAALLEAGFVEVGDPSMFEGIQRLRPLWLEGSTLVIELHHELKWPDRFETPSPATLFAAGVPSRSGVAGVMTLPEDLHAVMIAGHSWAHTPLRRLLDFVDVAAIAGGLDRRALVRLAESHGIGRIWRTTITVADDVLASGRPTLATHTWARHLAAARDRTVIESHLERLLSPLWGYPPRRVLGELGARVLDDVQPHLDEGWKDKSVRTGQAMQHAFVRRTEHDAQLGAAADRRRRGRRSRP